MFAYCGNSPITNIDSTGMLFEKNAGIGGGLAYAGPASGHIVRPVAQFGVSNTIPLVPFVPPSTFDSIESLRAEVIAIRKQNNLIEKTTERIKATVVSKSKSRYWSATLYASYVDVGRPLTYAQAVKEVTSGRNVFAVTWWEAKAVAIAAGGDTGKNNKSLVSEIHGGGQKGYYRHYHTYNRKGGHVYYMFGRL